VRRFTRKHNKIKKNMNSKRNERNSPVNTITVLYKFQEKKTIAKWKKILPSPTHKKKKKKNLLALKAFRWKISHEYMPPF
jgi:hypothetical protein